MKCLSSVSNIKNSIFSYVYEQGFCHFSVFTQIAESNIQHASSLKSMKCDQHLETFLVYTIYVNKLMAQVLFLVVKNCELCF